MRTTKRHIYLFLLLLFAKNVSAECDLEKTPLIRDNNCSWYLKEDKDLNLAYKKLSKILNKDNFTTLKKKQREWISWRNERCEAEQEKVSCGNSFCDGVAHDHCIIYLTEQRAAELRKFIINKEEAKNNQFDFSRKNKYLDNE